jgi:hypothetical protein
MRGHFLYESATLDLGNDTNSTSTTVTFADNLEAVKSGLKVCTINVNGGAGAVDTLSCDNNSAGKVKSLDGNLTFTAPNEQLDLGSCLLGSNAFTITMYGLTNSNTNDTIVNEDTSTDWTFGNNTSMTVNLPAGTVTTGTNVDMVNGNSCTTAVTWPVNGGVKKWSTYMPPAGNGGANSFNTTGGNDNWSYTT